MVSRSSFFRRIFGCLRSVEAVEAVETVETVEAANSADSAIAEPPTRPTVLVFSADGNRDNAYGIAGVVDRISEKAIARGAQFLDRGQPARLLKDYPEARAIWIIDHDIFLLEHKNLSRKVFKYVRKGGIVVLGGRIPTNIGPKGVFEDWMSRQWRLPWRTGQRVGGLVRLQNIDVGKGSDQSWQDGLPDAYDLTALFLTDVVETDAWYIEEKAGPSIRVTSSAVTSRRGPNTRFDAQAAVAFTKIGKGWLGYTGDVNNGTATQSAIMAMMRLL